MKGLFLLILLLSLAMWPGAAARAEEPQVIVEEVASGLEVPWALTFAPDGRLFVTERPGRIRIVEGGVLSPQPFATLEAVHRANQESGLMGIALDPLFTQNRYVYVVYTYRGADSKMWNRVLRLTDVGGEGRDPTIILDGIPGFRNHDGGALKFGPDGKLYLTTGDAGTASLAQDLSSLAGKVLRLNPDGSVPADNPFPVSYVFTYGHRNPQGMDWHPLTGALFITEHGPDDNDEVNILEPGKNYGWPVVRGIANTSPYQDSIVSFTPTIAVSGASFYSGRSLPVQWQNSFFFVALKATHLRRLTLAPPGYRAVTGQEELFSGRYGRLRAVEEDSLGYLYFTTSNRDGRGTPDPRDDRILRLVPSGAAAMPAAEPPAGQSPGGDRAPPPAEPPGSNSPAGKSSVGTGVMVGVLALLLLLGVWILIRRKRASAARR